MTRIFIVDDDPSIVSILEDIVNKNFKNSLIGSASTGTKAINEIKNLKPDIVLLDFLLPDKDGLEVVRSIRKEYYQGIIMISEVSDKHMVAKAYKEDIDFFISKPINVIEVVSVIKKVIEHLNIKDTLNKFEDALNSLKFNLKPQEDTGITDEQKLKKFYSKLGIIGLSGCDDLINAVIWAKSQNSEYVLSDLYSALDPEQSVAIKKRIARIITKAFKSMAALGSEDFMNPLFESYANQLFDFAEIRKEMNNLTGKSKKTGKINVKKFIESCIILMEEN